MKQSKVKVLTRYYGDTDAEFEKRLNKALEDICLETNGKAKIEVNCVSYGTNGNALAIVHYEHDTENSLLS